MLFEPIAHWRNYMEYDEFLKKLEEKFDERMAKVDIDGWMQLNEIYERAKTGYESKEMLLQDAQALVKNYHATELISLLLASFKIRKRKG